MTREEKRKKLEEKYIPLIKDIEYRVEEAKINLNDLIKERSLLYREFVCCGCEI